MVFLVSGTKADWMWCLMPTQAVGSTVAALRGRVQQMGGTEARAWPGPGRRSSQYKGVSWSEASAKWRSQCWDGSKVCSPADTPAHIWRVERVELVHAVACVLSWIFGCVSSLLRSSW